MNPPIKPDYIPNPPEGFTYAGKGDITGSQIFKTQQDIAGYRTPLLGWLTNMEGTSPYGHYAVRTDSPIHKAQPWYNDKAFEQIDKLMRLNPVLNRLAFFTDEDLEAELERRRKPKTIKINGIEVPEPMRIQPNNGMRYYFPVISGDAPYGGEDWSNDPFDFRILNRGMLHLTKEAAIKHAEVLISFTKLP